MNNDLLYQLALTEVPNVGWVQAKILAMQFGEAEKIFKAKQSVLEKIEGIGTVRANSIKQFNDFANAEQEIKFIEKFKIKPLFVTDKQYPNRLLNCYDSPTILFYKGVADLNASKIVAIVGTRTHTDYSKKVTEKLVQELSSQNILIVSGMAFGVDGIAHKAAIKNNLFTVGVLGHGLDQIYPPDHAHLAKDILKNGGGLLTEFRSKTKPDKHNFPTRNRIVAGMSDATIVVESGIKGGSMVTAELANGYNKDVFAFPGKVTDNKSAGCNYLIKSNKAMLLTDAQQLIEIMGWEEKKQKPKPKSQKDIFIELSKDEKLIIDILNEKETVHIDEINLRSGLSSSAIAAAILNLELQNVVSGLPGKIYKLS
ncbi:MAG TPA: DNA-processing protein DprA [Chitinophagaceae bacterium]|nr:DNA-processing protein DprA [Chitinophagaceae bacterium]